MAHSTLSLATSFVISLGIVNHILYRTDNIFFCSIYDKKKVGFRHISFQKSVQIINNKKTCKCGNLLHWVGFVPWRQRSFKSNIVHVIIVQRVNNPCGIVVNSNSCESAHVLLHNFRCFFFRFCSCCVNTLNMLIFASAAHYTHNIFFQSKRFSYFVKII